MDTLLHRINNANDLIVTGVFGQKQEIERGTKLNSVSVGVRFKPVSTGQ